MTAAVRHEIDGRVARVTLERPPLNVLDLDALAQLEDVAAELADAEDLQVVVIRGAGGRAFSAGVAVEDHVGEKVATLIGRFHAALRRLYALDPVTVAAVEGHCLGGGMELAAVCDLVVATAGSRFGQPEIKLGCFPPLAAALYPSRLGAAIAADLLLTGRTLDSAEAERLGFVQRRAEDGALDEALDALLAELTAHSTAALRITKRALRAGRPLELEPVLREVERLYLDELARTEDMEEGVAAFLGRRPPQWRHR